MWGVPLGDVLASMHVAKISITAGRLGADMPWIHRRAGDAGHLLRRQPDGCCQAWKRASV